MLIMLSRTGRKLRTSNTHQYKNYFITENLCPEFRQIFNKLYKLKKLKQISRVWSYNGYVYFKFSDNDIEEPIQLFHYDDIGYHILMNMKTDSPQEVLLQINSLRLL